MTADEKAIGDAINALASAILAKDSAAVVATYASDVTAYDLAPPLVHDAGQARDRAGLEEWFATWDGPIAIATHDLHIECAGNLAAAWSLKHMTGTKIDGEAQDLWYRSTTVLRRTDGAWQIAHLHESVPFAMDGSDRALLDLKP